MNGVIQALALYREAGDEAGISRSLRTLALASGKPIDSNEPIERLVGDGSEAVIAIVPELLHGEAHDQKQRHGHGDDRDAGNRLGHEGREKPVEGVQAESATEKPLAFPPGAPLREQGEKSGEHNETDAEANEGRHGFHISTKRPQFP